MEKSIITFSANEQNLQKTGGIGCYASDTVSYIEAQFELGENWSGYDSIRAVWFNDYKTISTVLDFNGVCIVPHEVLTSRGKVMVNLVGSVLVSDELSDRLTTFPCEAVKVTAKAKIEGSETQPITPSQFEQFVSIVISEVEKVTGMTAQAETLPAGSQATARYENGILYLGIPQGIQGERGETGADGADGNGIASVVYNADYSLTLVFDNGEQFTTPPIRGERGPAGADGTDGADGVTPNLSIGNVTTLESSEDAYVTRRGTDANPIFDFGIPKGDKGDNGTVPDLDLILPTDTASGDIASITDGQSVVPVKSLKVTLEPMQDLHGYDKPWSGGAGSNKYSIEIGDDVWIDNASGTTHSDNNGELIINTTTISYSGVYGGGQQKALVNQQSLAKTVSFDVKGAVEATIAVQGETVAVTTTYQRKHITIPANTSASLSFYGNGTANTIYVKNLAITEDGSTDFTPYSNICPISGRTECVTSVAGVNVWGGLKMASDIHNTINNETACAFGSDSDGDYLTLAASAPINDTEVTSGVKFKDNTQYTLIVSGKKSNANTTTNLIFLYTDGTLSYINFPSQASTKTMMAVTTSSGKTLKSINTLWGGGTTYLYYEECGVFEGVLTADQFEPYNGNTYTTTLGRTVYGGTLDVVSGELVVDRAMVDVDSTARFRLSSQTDDVAVFDAYFPDDNWASHASTPNAISNRFSTSTPSGTAGRMVVLLQHLYIVIAKSELSSLDESGARAWLNDHPTQLCYELATPQTYQLDPQTISLLHGNNNVWSDGSVEVTYNADVGLYIDKKLGTSGTRTLSMTRTLAKTDDTDDTKSDNIQLAED